MRRSTVLLALSLAGPASAQDAALHATYVGDYDVAGSTYSDVWADGTTAYIGRWGLNVVDVIDISNPASPFLTATITVPSPNNGCSAQDIKIGASVVDPSTTLGFIAFDAAGSDAFGIYDLTTPSSPSLLTTVQPGSYSTSHNLSYRADGWIATCNSFTSDLALIDLSGFDPSSPPVNILNWDYQISNIGTGFVHDITLTDDYLFVSQWDSMLVYDVSNLAGGPPVFLGEIGGYSNHAVWPTDDATYVTSTDERQGGSLRLYEMIDNGGSVTLNPLDSWVPPSTGLNAAYSAHNPVIKGNRVYLSAYNAGTLVFQIDRAAGTMSKVASYDTSAVAPTGFDGCWGVYPFNGEEGVLISDLQEGLFVVDFSGLEFNAPGDDRPLTVMPYSSTNTIQVEITELGTASLDSGTPMMYLQTNGGGFVGQAMSHVGGDLWEGTLPFTNCGDRFDYYFTADTTGAETFSSPTAAPTEFFTAYATVNLDPVFEDDFENDLGWSVTDDISLSSGTWERGVPIGTGLAPDEDDFRDGNAKCYVTGNGGGGVGDDDIDGGPTVLTSPSMDFDFGDGLISYSVWQAGGTVDSNDDLMVEISDDAGSNWTFVESIGSKAGGWMRRHIRVSDHVSPTSDVQIRFTIADNPNDSVLEAAIDNVVGSVFCMTPEAATLYHNGSGANANCFFSFPPVLGQNWVGTVTHSGHAGATATIIVFFPVSASGTFISAGELLVDLGSGKLLQSILPATGSSNNHIFAVPADITLLGLTSTVQGGILGGGAELCNAYTITIGF